jgi:uncharacterized protein (TIGR00369 family)
MQEPPDSPRRWCFGCGDRNPEGLHIDFEIDGAHVSGRFRPRETHQGWPGLAHGGVAAAVLDEAMGWAMYAAGAWAMTARMEVKYRRPLTLGEELLVTAEVTRDRGRRLEAEAAIQTLSGETVAQASGLFLRVPEERARELDARFIGTGDRQTGDLTDDEVPSRSSNAPSRSS